MIRPIREKLYYFIPNPDIDYKPWANEHMIEIIENIKGNIYTNISLIIHVEGKIDLIYSNLHKEVIKELIPLNSNKSNILEGLGFLFTFSNGLDDYKSIISQHAYNILRNIGNNYFKYDAHISEIYKDLKKKKINE